MSACTQGRDTADAPQSAAPQATASWPTGPTCDGEPAVSRAEEPDWPDFVVMDGRKYFAQGASDQPLTLGPVVGTVRCQLINSGTQRSYQPVNGDAAGLPAGTAIYAVAGQDSATVLATKTPSGIETWRPE